MGTLKRISATVCCSRIPLAAGPGLAAEPSMADRVPGQVFHGAKAEIDAKLIRAAGESIGTKGSPLDLARVPGSPLLVVKTDDGLTTINTATMKKAGVFSAKKISGSMHGPAVVATKAGPASAWFTDTGKQLVEVVVAADCMVVSPYAKPNAIVSRFYNQTSATHTMTRILGRPPLNQDRAVSPTMKDCFVAAPDLKPFASVPNQVPLDEHNKAKQAMGPDERKLAEAVDAMDFDRPDQADEDKLN